MTKQKADLLQGTLDMLILKSLSAGRLHGYGVGQRIKQLAEDMLRVEEGSLYPALYRLEERGWISSEWGKSENNRRARFYTLTRAGRRQLGVEEESWRRLVVAVGKVMETA
jgi:PadR family transcriptional regulator, regulatory protein PadR